MPGSRAAPGREGECRCDRARCLAGVEAGCDAADRPRALDPGPGRDGVNDLRIERDGEEVATLAIVDGRSLWPEGARELQAGERYDLILSDGEEAHRMEVLTDGDARARLVVRLPAAE